jgi:uncharacterized membrane protein SpoIIM required for sporulation
MFFGILPTYGFMTSEQLNDIQSMYQPGKVHIGRGGAQGDVQMFCFYIWSNVSIGFRTFAGGIFGGLPALFSLVFNRMNIGLVGSWLSHDSATRQTFWSFVITHSSVEIAGLVLSGVAGMRVGLSLIYPGRLSRRHALYAASRCWSVRSTTRRRPRWSALPTPSANARRCMTCSNARLQSF